MTTGKLAAWGPASARFASYGGQARCGLEGRDLSAEARRAREGGRWVVPDNVKELGIAKCQLRNANLKLNLAFNIIQHLAFSISSDH